MEGYHQKHLIFPLITIVFTVIVTFIFRSWSPYKTTLILSILCIVISAGIIFVKYLTFKRYITDEDALLVNICLAQIIACFVSIITIVAEKVIESRFVIPEHFIVLFVVLVITANMGMFGGISLIVIICSSVALYWIPIIL